MKLVLHIGAPKTATSSLQHTLSDLRPWLRQEGVAFVPTRRFQKDPVGRVVRREYEGLLGRWRRPSPDAFVTREAGDAGRLVISDEAVTGFLMFPTKKRSWRKMAHRAFVLNDFFDKYDYQVVLTVRRQDSFVASCYAHRVEHGRVNLSFDEYWKSEIDIDGMSWLTFIETLEKRHGRERLTVLTYETIRDGLRPLVLQFLEHGCGIDRARLADLEIKERHANPSFPAIGLELARIIADRMSEKKASLDAIRHVIRGLKPVFPAGRFEKFAPPLEELTAEMAKRFADENRLVAERYVAAPHPGFLFQDGP